MQHYTEQRDDDSADEIWLLQHEPVYTQGLAGKAEHLLNPKSIPVVHIDRGGQITYHGPGQVVMYLLLDIKRKGIGIRALVTMIEQSIIDTLAQYQISAHARRDAPGVYVGNGAKIASLGLKVRKGCTYHGAALNVDMDLSPFLGINPCGMAAMTMTQMCEFNQTVNIEQVGITLAQHFVQHYHK